MSRSLQLVSTVLAASAAAGYGQTQPADGRGTHRAELAIRDGDSVVFVGDELTESPRPHRSTNFPTGVESFMTVRYPALRVRYLNAGWSGDTVDRVLLRLDRDVLAHNPTVVVICLGLNDPDYQPFAQDRLDAFRKGLIEMVDRCRAAGARAWLISPPSVDEDRGKTARITRGGTPSVANLQAIAYNQTLGRYAAVIAEIAAGYDASPAVGFVDWFNQSLNAREAARQTQPDFAFSRDGRQPDPRGHALIAAALLRAWGAQPIHVAIDLNWVESTARIDVHDAEPRSVPVEVTHDDKRILNLEGLPLPWPILPASGGNAAEWEAASMCQFVFRMTDPPERISLTQEMPEDPRGRELTVSGDQLRDGYNLAFLQPLRSLKELTELHSLLGTKNYYRYRTWRQLELVPPREPELAEAQRQLTAAWNAFVAGYEDVIANRPKTFNARFVLAASEPTKTLPVSRPAPVVRPAPRKAPTTGPG